MKSDPLPSNNQETLESVKERFSTKLTDALYEKLTVDNIETFADEALDKITNLTTEIMEYYYDSNNITPNPDIEFKDQEDDAYTQLGLPKISNILDCIEEKKNEIDKIKDKIKKEYTDIVITPPQENNGGIIPGDGNGIEKKKLLPRLLTLMYILENDLEIDLESVTITEGQVNDNMMRRTPYVRVEVDNLERLVYICDEEGNASYVFDTEKLKEKRITPEDLDIDNKGDKNSLIAMHPGIGMRVVQTKNWRDKVKGYLENNIPQVGEAKNMLGEVEEDKFDSEFKKREKKIYLKYEEWVKELKEAYESNKDFEGTFDNWYAAQAKKNKGWLRSFAFAPKKYNVLIDDIYTSIGYKKKVEKQLHSEILPKEEWLSELKNIYNADKNFQGTFENWYKNKAGEHTGWLKKFSETAKKYNISIDDIYMNIGYIKKLEGQSQEEILPREEWLSELKNVYNADKNFEGTFENWYRVQAKKHKGWLRSFPAAPKKYSILLDEIYISIGYTKKSEVRSQKEILPREEWLSELKNAYSADKDFEGNFENWYSTQTKKHKGWLKKLSQAAKKYKISMDEIYMNIEYVKRFEKQNKEEILPREEWLSELKNVYNADKNFEGTFNNWYAAQAKKNKGWLRSFLPNTKKYNLSTNDIYKSIGYTKKK